MTRRGERGRNCTASKAASPINCNYYRLDLTCCGGTVLIGTTRLSGRLVSSFSASGKAMRNIKLVTVDRSGGIGDGNQFGEGGAVLRKLACGRIGK